MRKYRSICHSKHCGKFNVPSSRQKMLAASRTGRPRGNLECSYLCAPKLHSSFRFIGRAPRSANIEVGLPGYSCGANSNAEWNTTSSPRQTHSKRPRPTKDLDPQLIPRQLSGNFIINQMNPKPIAANSDHLNQSQHSLGWSAF